MNMAVMTRPDATRSETTDPAVAVTRRKALLWLGGAGVAFLGAACSSGASKVASSVGSSTTTTMPATTSAVAAASDIPNTTSTAAAASTASTAANASAATCVLTPEMTEGPYFIAGEAIRSDITDARPGAPLTLVLTVANASTCTPIKDATVEIWHADASGDYSGFGAGSSSRTFLRGGQVSDANGKVTFSTIYPGWYQGRATHIHLKAHVRGAVHTTQLFFDEATSDAVYAKSPYNQHSGQRTRNSQDGIFSGGGSRMIVPLTADASGYTGALALGVEG